MNEKQQKLLRLMASENDGEALAALRALQRTIPDWHAWVEKLSGDKAESTEARSFWKNATYRYARPEWTDHSSFFSQSAYSAQQAQAQTDLNEQARLKAQEAFEQRFNEERRRTQQSSRWFKGMSK